MNVKIFDVNTGKISEGIFDLPSQGQFGFVYIWITAFKQNYKHPAAYRMWAEMDQQYRYVPYLILPAELKLIIELEGNTWKPK